jgi:hypothetical protein
MKHCRMQATHRDTIPFKQNRAILKWSGMPRILPFYFFSYIRVQVLKPSVYYSIIAEIKFYDGKDKKGANH